VRLPTVDYVYGDPAHPDRVTRAISGPPYTPEDHALLAGLRNHEDSMCPGGCGYPIHVAWHADMDGWFDEVHEYVCHACSARDGSERKYPSVTTSRDMDAQPLPPFDMGQTTTASSPAPAADRPTDATLKGGDQ
jgi:hypothetical protein